MLETALARLDTAASHIFKLYSKLPPEQQVKLVEIVLVDSRVVDRDRVVHNQPTPPRPVTLEPEPVKSGPVVEALKEWRRETRMAEDIPSHHVIFNETIWAIAAYLPRTMEDLVKIKGIKEVKAKKYGEDILRIVQENAPERFTISAPDDGVPWQTLVRKAKPGETEAEKRERWAFNEKLMDAHANDPKPAARKPTRR